MTLTAIWMLLAATACAQQPPAATKWDFELLAPLHPDPQLRRGQLKQIISSLGACQAKLNLDEAGIDQVIEDVEVRWLPGSISRGSEGKLAMIPFIRGVIFYDQAIQGALKDLDPYRIECRLFVSGKREERSGVWRATQKYLQPMGFLDAFAYDTLDFSKIMGSIPGGKIHLLVEEQARKRMLNVASDPIIKDPAPIVAVFVRAEGAIEPLPTFTVPVGDAARMPPDTRAVLALPPPMAPADGDKAEKPAGNDAAPPQPVQVAVRFEVILEQVSRPDASQDAKDLPWWSELGEGAVLEARLGSLLTVKCTADQARLIARQPGVAQVRFPRGPAMKMPGSGNNNGQTKPSVRTATADSPLVILHYDFQGWREQLGKGLNPATLLVDLTKERNPGLVADPFPTPAGGIGAGTKLAIESTRGVGTAPVLVRIDPNSPAMIRRLVYALVGERYPNALLSIRQGEAREQINKLTSQLVRAEEGVDAAESSAEGDSAEQLKRLKEARGVVADLNKRINALTRIDQEVVFFQADLLGLAKAGVVVSGISWLEGHPQGGMAGVSRLIEDAFRGRLIWIQSVPETRAQVWSGTLADRDGNGWAELRVGVNNHDAEFLPLSWKSTGEGVAGPRRSRLTVQFHEAHHPDLVKGRLDLFSKPINRLRPLVVFQPVTALSGDPWSVVAQSDGVALKLQQDANGASWEQQVDVDMSAPGRYAIRLEADPAQDVVPRELASTSSYRKRYEAPVRMILSAIDATGTPQWAEASGWRPERPEWVATPGLADGIITVGPASALAASDILPDMKAKPEIGLAGPQPLRQETDELLRAMGRTASQATRSWMRGQGAAQTRAMFQKIDAQSGY